MNNPFKTYLSVFILGTFLIGCKQQSKDKVFTNQVEVVYSNKINVESKFFGLKKWVTDEEKFNNGFTVKLDPSHKYGLNDKISNLSPDAFVRVTVWKKGKSGGNIALTCNEIGFQKYSRKVIEQGKNGWNKIILEEFLPANFQGEEVKVFLMNDQNDAAYFADLEIKVFNHKPYPKYNSDNAISFIIDKKDINYINKKRIKSFERGIITKKTKKEFDAIAIFGGVEYRVTMRIKGDWIDHIEGNKWSFRVKMKEGSFKGMKEFSIQQPGTRGFLNEYVLHKIFEEEDVLTTRYGFIPVKINGASVGIYAYEEHFDKGLVESKKRREGPLLKFDESHMWNMMRINRETDNKFITTPNVESALILPFKKKKTMHSKVLKQQFIIGQNLLNQYRYDDAPVSELFKVDKMAKFYAITNIGSSWHSLRWHNERYYFDPIDSKLEIIAFDCYATSSIDKKKAWLSPNLIFQSPILNYDSYLELSPFNDKLFTNRYMSIISEYLFTDKILEIIEKDHEVIKNYEEWINREYAFYHYDYKFFEKNIAQLKQDFKTLEKKLKNNPLKTTLKINHYNFGENGVIKGFSLQGFTESFANIKVKNFHSKPLYLIGYSSKQRPEQGISYFKEPIKFEGYKDYPEVESKNVSCLYSPDKIYFKEDLNDTLVYNNKVMPWPQPEHTSPRQELLKNSLSKTTEYAKVENGEILFKPGKYEINKPIVIPAGYKVIINNKTQLDFVKGAFFMSFSPVEITGTASQKVIIESSDETGMGFTIIDAQGRSEIKHVRFKGWNTLNYQGWILTGAVTFYESDVDIESTEFLNNNCEDALNIVRADFLLKHSLIAHTFADGFDADFTTGLVYDCDFKQIGNDGIDYSGSEINIENVRIDGAGDKGISGGEASTLVIKNVVISNSNIGVASKDRSNLTIENIKLINCNCGFAAYQKKTEYGPAEMSVVGFEMNKVNDVFMLGLESVIDLDGDVNKGETKLNIDSLYAQ